MAGRKHRRIKKKKRVTVGAVAAGFILAILIITALSIIIQSNRENAEVAATGAGIFFYDAQANGLKPEFRHLPDTDNAGKVKFVLEELVVGPRSTVLLPSVPADLVKSATVSGTNVDVTVSGKYYGLKGEEELICRAALVHSLTHLPFIETVTINIDGSELVKPNGQPFGKIAAQDIVMSPDVSPQGESPRTITLYFADLNNTGLITEMRVISANPDEPATRYIVQELIKGPESENLSPTVPAETKLLEIDVKDGVCSVDLSRDFITRHTGDPGTELLSIYSIVNSLCEQSDIKNVQFLIEGKRQEQFKGETGFNNLYEAREMPVEASE